MRDRQLTVSQAARALGRSITTLRRYDRRGILRARRDPANNYRYYTEDDVARFRQLTEAGRDQRELAELAQEVEYRFIDLFAGVGGLRLGFRDVGKGHCLFSSEIDRFACRTYEANFREAPEGDITKIGEGAIPAHDLLLAGFPCQPFSLAGVSKKNSLDRPHGFDDPTQGTLFFDIKRILKHHKPSAFLLENVKHLERHDRGRTFQVILDSLEGLGYHVHQKVIDAAGVVPQHRERIFIVGFDRDVPFTFPELPIEGPKLESILDPHEEVDPKYTLSSHLWGYLQDYADKHRKKGNGFGFSVADPDGVTRTLSARYHKDGSEILIGQPGANPRRLTPEECRRLMGFPDDFRFPDDVSDTQRYRQMGNAVVVPVVRAVAERLIGTLAAHYPPLMQTSLFDGPSNADAG